MGQHGSKGRRLQRHRPYILPSSSEDEESAHGASDSDPEPNSDLEPGFIVNEMKRLENDETSSEEEVRRRVEEVEQYLHKIAEKKLSDPLPPLEPINYPGFANKRGKKPSSKTAEAYKALQDEFISWYQSKHSRSTPMVNSALVVLFLFDRVIDQTDRSSLNSLAHSYRKCKDYHAALQHLWWYQRRTMSNPFGPLTEQHSLMTQFIELQRIKHQRFARWTSSDQLVSTNPPALRKGLPSISRDAACIEKFAINSWYMAQGDGILLRNRALLILNYHFSLEDAGAERIRLNSLVSLRSDNAEFTKPASIIGFIHGANKIAPRGIGLLRHKNVEVCPVSSVALYLFWRFHVSGEEVPDFLSLSWQSMPLFPKIVNKRPVPITCLSRRKALQDIFDATDLDDKPYRAHEVTRSAGQWERGKFQRATLKSSKEAICVAGFSGNVESYNIPRGDIDPPTELCEKIFPGLTTALEGLRNFVCSEKSCKKVDSYYADYLQSIQERVSRAEEISEVDCALIGIQILSMLKDLRAIVLQDAVFLKGIHPQLKIWQHEIFSNSAFADFAERLQQHEKLDTIFEVESPMSSSIQESSISGNYHEHEMMSSTEINGSGVTQPKPATQLLKEKSSTTSAQVPVSQQQLMQFLNSFNVNNGVAVNEEGRATQLKRLEERLNEVVATHGEISTTVISLLAKMEGARQEIGSIKEKLGALSK